MRRRVWMLALFVAAAAAGSGGARADSDGFRIIVNPTNPAMSIDRSFAAQAFLRKVQSWGDGRTIRPVDLGRDSPLRRTFSGEVLRRSVAAVRSYWQQMIFSGRAVPPPELASEEDVVTYVLREPGGVGYVGMAVDLRGAKVLVLK